jgi:hypothetical protein
MIDLVCEVIGTNLHSGPMMRRINEPESAPVAAPSPASSRDAAQAEAAALREHRGRAVGPVRRVSSSRPPVASC